MMAEPTDANGEESEGEAGASGGDDSFAPEPAEGRERNGDRRRRRGRRGGRRRREREEGAQPPEFAPFEPEVVNAVGDLDRPWAPPGEPQSQPPASDTYGATHAPSHQDGPEQRDEAAAAPVAAPAASSPAPQPAVAQPTEHPPEHPRRRSTVREPAPFVIGSGEAPVAPPPLRPSRVEEPSPEIDTGPAAESGPRRTGWWSRRIMGNK